MTIIEDLQSDNPGPRIHLYKLDFTTALRYDVGAGAPTIVYLTNDQNDITFDSVVYTASTSFKFTPDAYRLNSEPEPTLTFFGQYSTLLDAVNGYTSIVGATVTRIFTLGQYLDDGATPDPTQFYAETPWYISQLVSSNKNELKFSLLPALGLNQKVLSKQSLETFNT